MILMVNTDPSDVARGDPASPPGDPDFRPVETMELTGGDVSLDFVNTAGGRDERQLREKLRTYGDLVTWAERVGLVSEERGARLRDRARVDPDEANRILTEARALREALFRLFARPDPAPQDLDLVAAAAARAHARLALVTEAGGYAFEWPEDDRLDRVLWPVALSAADLLTSEDRERVKECASHTCEWLFLDMSKNRSRRWCDMKVCGNRAKARRFSERQKSRDAEPG